MKIGICEMNVKTACRRNIYASSLFSHDTKAIGVAQELEQQSMIPVCTWRALKKSSSGVGPMRKEPGR